MIVRLKKLIRRLPIVLTISFCYQWRKNPFANPEFPGILLAEKGGCSIAVDMVKMAYEDKYDVAYLISADGDFVYPGVRVRYSDPFY